MNLCDSCSIHFTRGVFCDTCLRFDDLLTDLLAPSKWSPRWSEQTTPGSVGAGSWVAQPGCSPAARTQEGDER